MAMRYLPALMEVKPAVTLAVGGSLLAVHFRMLGPLPFLYGTSLQQVCLMPGAILYDVELLRFVTGVLTHISDYVRLPPSPSRCAASPPDCRCGVQQLDTRAPGRQRPLKNPALYILNHLNYIYLNMNYKFYQLIFYSCSVLPLLAASNRPAGGRLSQHLYWTLGSLAAKGLALEPRIGSANFATLLLALTVVTSIVTVLLSFSIYNLLGDHGWMKNCYLGASPVSSHGRIGRPNQPASGDDSCRYAIAALQSGAESALHTTSLSLSVSFSEGADAHVIVSMRVDVFQFRINILNLPR